MEPQQYYVTRPDKTQEGPYDINSLITRYQAGKYPTNSLVWCEGMSGWENIQQWIQKIPASSEETEVPQPSFPQGAAPSFPQGAAPSSPQGAPSYPQGAPSYPQGAPSFPQGTPSFPQGTPSFPQGAPSYPQGTPSSPQGAAPSYPQGAPSFPQTPQMPTAFPSNTFAEPAPLYAPKEYYVIDDYGNKIGPYSLDDLELLLRKTRFYGNELCWKQGWQNWVPLNNILNGKNMSTQSKIAVFLFCVAAILAIISLFILDKYSIPREYIECSYAFNLTFLGASIFLLIRLYKAWKALQSLPSHIKHVTPGQAIGFLFIPLFNYYWVFVAFCKVSTWGNILLKRRKYISLWPFLTHCILGLLIFLLYGWAQKKAVIEIRTILFTALCITDIFVLYHIDRLIAKFQKDKALY